MSKHLSETKLHLNGLNIFVEHFLVLLKKLNWCQQKIRFLTSMNLRFEKESHAHETPGKNLSQIQI